MRFRLLALLARFAYWLVGSLRLLAYWLAALIGLLGRCAYWLYWLALHVGSVLLIWLSIYLQLIMLMQLIELIKLIKLNIKVSSLLPSSLSPFCLYHLEYYTSTFLSEGVRCRCQVDLCCDLSSMTIVLYLLH